MDLAITSAGLGAGTSVRPRTAPRVLARMGMGGWGTVGAAAAAALVVLLGLFQWLAPFGGDAGRGDAPYLAVAGGGFVFNYRIAEVTYGLVARVDRTIPAGTRIVTAFENPAGGAPLVTEQVARAGLAKLILHSPPVTGVVAGRPYGVTVRLVDPADGAEIGRLETSFTSNVDQSLMPSAPLTVGPGYQRPAAP